LSPYLTTKDIVSEFLELLALQSWLPITDLLCYFFGSFTGANPVIDSKKQRHITHYSTTAITVASAHPYLQ
jgi:hypothetical protein